MKNRGIIESQVNRKNRFESIYNEISGYVITELDKDALCLTKNDRFCVIKYNIEKDYYDLITLDTHTKERNVYTLSDISDAVRIIRN